jgi:antitoxin ParD1/3/4
MTDGYIDSCLAGRLEHSTGRTGVNFALGNCCQLGDNGNMPTRNVNLSQQQAAFIRQRIDEGQYRNASEVVRAGLRLLEQHEQEDKLKLRALKRLATESFSEIDRGESQIVEPGSLEQFVAKVDATARATKPR